MNGCRWKIEFRGSSLQSRVCGVIFYRNFSIKVNDIEPCTHNSLSASPPDTFFTSNGKHNPDGVGICLDKRFLQRNSRNLGNGCKLNIIRNWKNEIWVRFFIIYCASLIKNACFQFSSCSIYCFFRSFCWLRCAHRAGSFGKLIYATLNACCSLPRPEKVQQK